MDPSVPLALCPSFLSDADPRPLFLPIAFPSQAFFYPLRRRGEVPLAHEQRKLAAILAADVVGYSRLMGRDEEAPCTSKQGRVEPAIATCPARCPHTDSC